MAGNPLITLPRLDCVQLLRAFAAVAVVTHHIPILANGAWGVDLFFVISGFIMCYVTEASGDHFFAKRIIRVVPLYWIGTFGVFAIALMAPRLLNNTTASPLDLVRSLLFIPFMKGSEVHPVMFLGWTLNYEMLFYVMFAIAMKFSHRHRAAICSGLICALVLIGGILKPESTPMKFWTNSIILEFVLGIGCYQIWRASASPIVQKPGITSRFASVLLGIAFLACLPVFRSLIHSDIRFLKYGIVAALGFHFTLRGLSDKELPKPIVMLGDASYSLYLFHPYLIQLFVKISGVLLLPSAFSYLVALVIIIACCLVAVTSYFLIEKPLTSLLRTKCVRNTPLLKTPTNI